jgi:hypothetical protein
VTALYTALLDVEDDIKDDVDSSKIERYKYITKECEADLEELQDLININSRRRNNARTGGVKIMVKEIRARLQDHVNNYGSLYDSELADSDQDQVERMAEPAPLTIISPPSPPFQPLNKDLSRFHATAESVTDSGDDYNHQNQLLQEEEEDEEDDETISESGSDRTISGPVPGEVLTPPASDAGRPLANETVPNIAVVAPNKAPDRANSDLYEKVTSWKTSAQDMPYRPFQEQHAAASVDFSTSHHSTTYQTPPRPVKPDVPEPTVSSASMWSNQATVGTGKKYDYTDNYSDPSRWSVEAEYGDDTYQNSKQNRRSSAVSKLRRRPKSTDEILADIAEEEYFRDSYPGTNRGQFNQGKSKDVQFTGEDDIFYPQQPQPPSPDAFSYPKYGGPYGPTPMKPRYYPNSEYNQYPNQPYPNGYSPTFDQPYSSHNPQRNPPYNPYGSQPYPENHRTKPEQSFDPKNRAPPPPGKPWIPEPNAHSWMEKSRASYFVDVSGKIWTKQTQNPYGPYGQFPPYPPYQQSPKEPSVPKVPEPPLPKPAKQKSKTKPPKPTLKIEPKVEVLERPLVLSLEEIFYGTKKHLRVKRKTFETETGIIGSEDRVLVLPIKKGILPGTKIKFANAGDQGPGTIQDIHFITSEVCRRTTKLAKSNHAIPNKTTLETSSNVHQKSRRPASQSRNQRPRINGRLDTKGPYHRR